MVTHRTLVGVTWRSDGGSCFSSCGCCPGCTCGWTYVCARAPSSQAYCSWKNKAGFSSHPSAVTQISNWPGVSWTQLFERDCAHVFPASLSAVFLSALLAVSAGWLAGWLAVGKGTSSPIVPGPREHSYKLNQCRMQNTDGHWLTNGFMEKGGCLLWVHWLFYLICQSGRPSQLSLLAVPFNARRPALHSFCIRASPLSLMSPQAPSQG